MTHFKRIGVLTSGGDAPGMNTAVRAVVRTAVRRGVEVMAIYRGYSGLISGDIRLFDVRDVSNTINKGGTILYSDRCPEMRTPEGLARAVENCHKFGIDGLVCIGGDGTFKGAMALTNAGIPCVGIPATIDNDIASTDNTIGYDTAMNTVVDLIDKLRDTCESHARCNVVEVMGRGCGDIALNTGIASGATAVVIPEFPHDDNSICKKIRAGRDIGKRNFIVIVSEGVGAEYGPALTEKIENETGVESRFARLAHIVRGGSPSLRDRILASRLGVLAVEELLLGRSNIVVCERDNQTISEDIYFALAMDDMYKDKLKDGALDRFSEAEIQRMRDAVEQQKKMKLELYGIENKINI
jgi:6-phosphofructokinase 1